MRWISFSCSTPSTREHQGLQVYDNFVYDTCLCRIMMDLRFESYFFLTCDNISEEGSPVRQKINRPTVDSTR